ncbi:diuretic hormone class 2-like [Limulus polyphemus]|uniref:Diuretic hormone class 2-like n=1 Tax=Limulus polyphemus TaxID=6850 RepID=A0ABM1B220_LIMPO|nr:diuretic hormone class 2-like [Limulus polyphemus]
MVKVFVTVLLVMTVLSMTLSASLAQPRYRRALVEIDDPDEVIRVLTGIMDNLISSESVKTDKRGLDLGLSRGFSGSQAAKHLMGLAAANFAGGPGRRRRDVSEEE